MEQIFANAKIIYSSFIPRTGVLSPVLAPTANDTNQVPYLSLHLGLVKAYWSVRETWKPWNWLEQDFALLRKYGFNFAQGSISEYGQAVESAASQFAEWVERIAAASSVSAIAVYGRGHWSMNAGARAAKQLSLPLYVVERGILPNSYIVDKESPFVALGSRFRSGWYSFRTVEDWDRRNFASLTESRWQLYIRLSNEKYRKDNDAGRGRKIIVGQCLFDYNCLGAPFTSPSNFIEYVCREKPEVLKEEVPLYRPHPLSPEEYPGGKIETGYGSMPVDFSDPWQRLRERSCLYTWNSTLGLEGSLVFDLPVNILDSQCHYRWVLDCPESDKRMYISYLNEISTLVTSL